MANDPVITPTTGGSATTSPTSGGGSSPSPKTTAERDAIASPTAGQMVYNTDTKQLNIYTGFAWGPIAISALAPDKIQHLFAWYKADSLALTDNAFVSSWADSSPSGLTLTRATGDATRPLYKAAGINGKPALFFDGLSNRRFMASVPVTIAQPFTVIAALTLHATANMVMLGNGFAGAPTQLYANSLCPTLYAGAGISAPPLPIDVPFVFTGIFNGASSSIRINGVQVAFGDVGTQGFSAQAFVIGALGNLPTPTDGGSWFWDGLLGDIAIYNALVPISDASLVENSLLGKYSIPGQAHG